MDRAYSLLEIKSVDRGPPHVPRHRVDAGARSAGDIVDPAGVTFRNPVPLLFHHDTEQPIGTAHLAVTAEGIAFEATCPELDEPGPLKTASTKPGSAIKAGVITGVSIGYRILEGGVEHLKIGRPAPDQNRNLRTLARHHSRERAAPRSASSNRSRPRAARRGLL